MRNPCGKRCGERDSLYDQIADKEGVKRTLWIYRDYSGTKAEGTKGEGNDKKL